MTTKCHWLHHNSALDKEEVCEYTRNFLEVSISTSGCVCHLSSSQQTISVYDSTTSVADTFKSRFGFQEKNLNLNRGSNLRSPDLNCKFFKAQTMKVCLHLIFDLKHQNK